MSREAFDLLWEVVRSGERLGYEVAICKADRTRVDKAFKARQLALAKAVERLEVRSDKGLQQL